MKNPYKDIICLPRPVSKTRPQMPISDRAAQFSPFAALTGHSAAIRETARLTKEKTELDETVRLALNGRLQTIAGRISEGPEVQITYFQHDVRKCGGSYVTAVGTVKKIDEYERTVAMSDGSAIPLDEIVGIEGQIFEGI